MCRLPWTKSNHHQESVPFALISQLLDQLSHAKVYIKIDLHGTYNLVRIREGDEWKTSFNTCYCHFEYFVMPFRLPRALIVFQYMMNDVLCEYLDDLWFITSMTSSFSQRTLPKMNAMYILFWKSTNKLVFMPN